jgi:hypothetical protein
MKSRNPISSEKGVLHGFRKPSQDVKAGCFPRNTEVGIENKR